MLIVVCRSCDSRLVTFDTSQVWTGGNWMSSHSVTSNSIKTNNVLRSIFQIFLRGWPFQIAKLTFKERVANSIPIKGKKP